MENKATRETLIEQLNTYEAYNAHEDKMLSNILGFVINHENCFLRSNLKGQVTASAWILDYDHQHVLMLHHTKLDKWLQPGGHTDGNPDVLAVAQKEVEEETGLTTLISFGEEIFDIDVHDIPAYKDVPAHKHYDVRFIFEADIDEPLVINHESKELKWVPLDEVKNYNSETSIMRMVEKTYEIG
ncbi:NUDIX hydrolase [Chondrinema litorale]|uniref:NUDIX hydrolase n=1 Tax=Chondrinema litorale TaxID=2994555 RepID=UPI002543C2C2|nr:NUDIX hydrolase [Chondrinema litorale]UZR93920.1 NUDIX hydrolase [Chondrinema litorale]